MAVTSGGGKRGVRLWDCVFGGRGLKELGKGSGLKGWKAKGGLGN